MMFLLVHSKSKAIVNASRTRVSLNLSRRVLMNQPCAPDGLSSGRPPPLDAAVVDCGKIVAGRPDARGELLAEQVIAAGEAFEADVAVAIVFVPHVIEIVRAAVDRQVLAPPVLHAFELHVAAGLEPPDPVRARAERHFERGLSNGRVE